MKTYDDVHKSILLLVGAVKDNNKLIQQLIEKFEKSRKVSGKFGL